MFFKKASLMVVLTALFIEGCAAGSQDSGPTNAGSGAPAPTSGAAGSTATSGSGGGASGSGSGAGR